MDIRIVATPEFPPGACFLTNTDIGPFVDTGLDIDDLYANEGRVYLAVSTISGFAQQLGFAPPEATRRQTVRLEALESDLAAAVAANENLIAANSALHAAGYRSPEAPLHVPAGSVEEVLNWITSCDSLVDATARAQAAYDAEMLEAAPRAALLSEVCPFIDKELPDGVTADL